MSPETPEADALEQMVGPDSPPDDEPVLGLEVPEADALEQARAVPVADDEDYR